MATRNGLFGRAGVSGYSDPFSRFRYAELPYYCVVPLGHLSGDSNHATRISIAGHDGLQASRMQDVVHGAYYQSIRVEEQGPTGVWHQICSFEENGDKDRIFDPMGAGPARRIRVTCYHIYWPDLAKPMPEPHQYIENRYLHAPFFREPTPDQLATGMPYSVLFESNDGGSKDDANSNVLISWFW